MYGFGNPVDALYTYGKYVRNVHAKDGLPPTDPRRIGKEVNIGEGHVDFEKVFSLPDRTIYKSNYPVNMLTNFVADTELAQGLAGNNVAVNSDLCVSKNADFNTIQFGCTTDSNLIKAGSKVYLFGI